MPGAEDELEKEGQAGSDDKEKQGKAGDEGQTGADDKGGEAGDDFSDPAKALAEIKKLRAENAKHRTKNKALDEQMSSLNGKFTALKKALGVEDDEEDPEVKIGRLHAENQALALEVSISRISREHEIPAGQEKYFRFLLAEKMEALEDGQEIGDDDVAEIAAEVKKISGKAAGNSTGVSAGKKPNADGGTTLTVQAFAKMNTGEKSELYAKNPSEYTRLFNEAKSQRMI